MTTTDPTTVQISKLYGGISVPRTQVVRVTLPYPSKVYGPGNNPVEAGTVVTVAVVSRENTDYTHGTYANVFVMAPGLPQRIGTVLVSMKKRGRTSWVEYGKFDTLEEYVESLLINKGDHAGCAFHLIPMPDGFSIAEHE